MAGCFRKFARIIRFAFVFHDVSPCSTYGSGGDGGDGGRAASEPTPSALVAVAAAVVLALAAAVESVGLRVGGTPIRISIGAVMNVEDVSGFALIGAVVSAFSAARIGFTGAAGGDGFGGAAVAVAAVGAGVDSLSSNRKSGFAFRRSWAKRTFTTAGTAPHTNEIRRSEQGEWSDGVRYSDRVTYF